MIEKYKKIKAIYAPKHENLSAEERVFIGQEAYFMPYAQLRTLTSNAVVWRFAVCNQWLHELVDLKLDPREFSFVDEEDLVIEKE